MRRLCVVADDYGLSPGIDEAILQLAGAGRIQAFSCMVGAPGWDAAARRLREARLADVDIGLHLDLTEHPLLPGSRSDLAPLIGRCLLRARNRALLRREVAAQFEAFEQALGRAPDHVDGHQHVHQLPQVRDALAEQLRQRPNSARPWLRSTRRPPHDDSGFKGRVIEALGAQAIEQLARELGLAHNAHLLGVYDFARASPPYAQRLQAWLRGAADADLLLCHPSTDPHARGADDPSDPIAAARWAEYQVLAGDGFAAAVTAAGLRLQPLSRVLRELQAVNPPRSPSP